MNKPDTSNGTIFTPYFLASYNRIFVSNQNRDDQDLRILT